MVPSGTLEAFSTSLHLSCHSPAAYRVRLRAPASSAIFISIIVKAPIVQILSMTLAIMMIALDYPAPFVKGTMIHRSLVIRIPLLLLQAFFAILYYQVRPNLALSVVNYIDEHTQGTNGAIWSLIAAGCYARAIALGEKMKDPEAASGGRGAVSSA